MNQIETYVSSMHEVLDSLDVELIEAAVALLAEARVHGRQVFVMGNGGSASTASHFACDLTKNTRISGKISMRVIALTDNMALLSALANDEGYENVFAEQVASLMRPGDLLIAISTSGRSPNVLRAVKLSKQFEAKTIGLTGFDGGELAQSVDLNLQVKSNSIEQIEDVHLMLGHMLTVALRQLALNGHGFDHSAVETRLANAPVQAS